MHLWLAVRHLPEGEHQPTHMPPPGNKTGSSCIVMQCTTTARQAIATHSYISTYPSRCVIMCFGAKACCRTGRSPHTTLQVFGRVPAACNMGQASRVAQSLYAFCHRLRRSRAGTEAWQAPTPCSSRRRSSSCMAFHICSSLSLSLEIR